MDRERLILAGYQRYLPALKTLQRRSGGRRGGTAPTACAPLRHRSCRAHPTIRGDTALQPMVATDSMAHSKTGSHTWSPGCLQAMVQRTCELTARGALRGGADDQVRTGDLYLGKVARFQLRYVCEAQDPEFLRLDVLAILSPGSQLAGCPDINTTLQRGTNAVSLPIRSRTVRTRFVATLRALSGAESNCITYTTCETVQSREAVWSVFEPASP